jgi:hypothetical protein
MVVSVMLASYLALVTTESRAVSRSQTWNACVPVMEAGVEEAMAQIRACNNTTNLGINNWTLGTNGFYEKTRTIGSDGSFCKISIQPVLPPVIYSIAYVPVAMANSKYITRKVKVTTMKPKGGSGGLIAAGSINLKGMALLDSFDSSSGPYNPTNHGTNAIALSMGTNAGIINMSGGNIFGIAVTGPGGSVNTGGGASVGDTAWNASHNGIQPGWSANDANVQLNDNPVPDTTGWIPSILSGQIGGVGTNYTYLLNGASYFITGALSLSSSQVLAVSGNSKLYVTGDVNITGSAYVYLAPGATLTVYLGGSGKFGGGGIVNASSLASNVKILGLPTCTSITMNGGSAFYGIINAPEADIGFGGSSDSYGSYTAKTISVTGGGSIHYDQALGGSGAIVVASWNEL